MLNKISDWIHYISKGWVALSALVIFVLFTVLVLPGQSSRTEVETRTAGSPDMSFFYTSDELYQMAEVYGQAGREAYIQARFTFDLVWPLVYTVFLATAISWLLQKAFAPESLWQRLNLVPVLAALCDYLENIFTSLVMLQFPNRMPLVAVLASVFTMGKWILIGVSFVLLIMGVVIGVWRWLKNNR